MAQPNDGDEFRSHWFAFPASIFLHDREPDGPPVTIELRAADRPAVIEVSGGSITTVSGPAVDPDVISPRNRAAHPRHPLRASGHPGSGRLSASRSAGIRRAGAAPARARRPAGPSGSSSGKEIRVRFTAQAHSWNRRGRDRRHGRRRHRKPRLPAAREPRTPPAATGGGRRSPMRRWRRTTPTVTCRSRVTRRCARLRQSNVSAMNWLRLRSGQRHALCCGRDSTASSTSCWRRSSPAARSSSAILSTPGCGPHPHGSGIPGTRAAHPVAGAGFTDPAELAGGGIGLGTAVALLDEPRHADRSRCRPASISTPSPTW